MPSKIRSRNRARALGWSANINLRHEASLSLIRLGHFFLKFPGVARVHEIDRRSAETAAGHARAVNAFLLVRQVHHQIQFAAAHFVQIAKTAVRFGHAHTEPRDIAGAEGLRAIEYARVFRDNVQGTLVDDLRQYWTVLFELLKAHVPQSAYP